MLYLFREMLFEVGEGDFLVRVVRGVLLADSRNDDVGYSEKSADDGTNYIHLLDAPIRDAGLVAVQDALCDAYIFLQDGDGIVMVFQERHSRRAAYCEQRRDDGEEVRKLGVGTVFRRDDFREKKDEDRREDHGEHESAPLYDEESQCLIAEVLMLHMGPFYAFSYVFSREFAPLPHPW